VVLKKPSELFSDDSKNEKSSIINNIKEKIENNQKISEDFSLLKEKLNNFGTISDFNEVVESYKDNVNQISSLSKEVDFIKEEIKNLSKRENLDKSMATYLLSIESYIEDVQENIKDLNLKSTKKIKKDFIGLKSLVKDFIENDIPKYDKLLIESEIRSGSRIDKISNKIDKKLESVDLEVENKFKDFREKLDGINENKINDIRNDINLLYDQINTFSKEDLPKYNKLFVEEKIKNEESFKDLEEKIFHTISSFDEKIKEKILDINSTINEFSDREIPKYNKLFVEFNLKTEKEIKEIESNLKNKLESLASSINEIQK